MESLEISDDALAEISFILEMKRRFSVSAYKDKCMKRRVAIRMRSCHCLDAAAYCNLLRQSDREIDLLQQTLTIHVSQFFRNPSMFVRLQETILPELFRTFAPTGRLSIWSLGCSSGEEAYSVAIIIKEYFSRQLQHTTVAISATDIDDGILQTAITANYTEERLKELPELLKTRYFTPDGPRVQLVSEIRGMVAFRLSNIMDVEQYEPSHLVLCRNTLIYFTRPEQEKILHGVARILPTGGILVLGKSETLVGDVRRHFTTVCPVERIYRRN